MKCPKCGSKKLAPILYGMPAFDEEMKRKLDNQELVLGGCCISGDEPQYHCFGCGKDICTPPVLGSRRGQEDYWEIVTSVRFFDWQFNDIPSSISRYQKDGGKDHQPRSVFPGWLYKA